LINVFTPHEQKHQNIAQNCVYPPPKKTSPTYIHFKAYTMCESPFQKKNNEGDGYFNHIHQKKNAEPESSRLKAAQTLHDLPPTRLKRRCTLALHGGLVATTLKMGKKLLVFQPYISRFWKKNCPTSFPSCF